MFSYKPLLKLLIDNDLSKTQFRLETGISMATLAKIGEDEYISMSTLDTICKYFDCKIEDVVKFINDDK